MNDFLAAVALLLVFEGILPFLSPNAVKKYMLAVLQSSPGALRIAGAMSICLGLLLLWAVRA